MTAGATPATPAEQGWLREAAQTVGAGLLVVCFGLVLLARDPSAFWRDDYQTYHLAGYCDMARAWQQGEFPLLSPSTWMCGALAAEYQCGVFSVVVHPCAVAAFHLGLTLPATAAVLSLVHLAVLAAGAFRLARWRGLPTAAAMLVALVAALNGYVLLWAARSWFPALASFAWVPWFWWGLERAVRPGGPARFVPAGLFLYLIATAGWPFTVLMAGVLSAWLMVKQWLEQRRLGPLWPVVASWSVGLALSAPAWLLLVEYSAHTLRDRMPAEAIYQWRVPASALWGLFFPAWVSEWNVFGIEKPHQAIELAGGLVPLVLIFTAWRSAGLPFLRRHAAELLLVLLVLGLALLPGVAAFRWSMRWLPLFFLTLGLVGGQALAALPVGPGRPNPGVRCLVLVAALGGLAWLTEMEPTAHVRQQTLILTLLAAGWAVAERWLPGLVGRIANPSYRMLPQIWVPCLVLLGSCLAAFWDARHFIEVAEWPLREDIRQAAPLDPARRYFNVQGLSDMLEAEAPTVATWNWGKATGLRPGNAWMYAGVSTVNGYSPMVPAELYGVLRFVSHAQATSPDAERVVRHWSQPGGFLEFLGVNGLLVADRFAAFTDKLERHGWRKVTAVDGGTLWHRGEAPAPQWRIVEHVLEVEHAAVARQRLRDETGAHTPLLVSRFEHASAVQHLTFAAAQVEPVRVGRNSVELAVVNPATEREALVVFLRPWFPGYRARLEGMPLPVTVADALLPAVRLPPGARGRLVLEYRPTALLVGGGLAGGALAGLLILMGFAWFQRRRG